MCLFDKKQSLALTHEKKHKNHVFYFFFSIFDLKLVVKISILNVTIDLKVTQKVSLILN